jgi:3-oxoacyl-[acyl-carrier protein] reductase
MSSLHGRIAVVTGGGRGIGRSIAARLLDAGAQVILWDRDAAALDQARAELPKLMHAVVMDQATWTSVEAAAADAIKAAGRIDILVNNAAVFGCRVPLWEYPLETWRDVVDVNLHGQFHCCRAVVPHMRRQRYGRIVNMTSLAAKEGHANFAAYCVSKAGIHALTKCLSKEVATDGILVNAVAPGTIESDSLAAMDASFQQAVLSRTPMARFGRAEEVASMVCWLCSDEASFTTGALFDVSGGRTSYQ